MPEPVSVIVASSVAAVASVGNVALSFFQLCMAGYCRSECCCWEMEHFSPEDSSSRHSATDCDHASPLQVAPVTPEVAMMVDKPLKLPAQQTH